VTMFIHRGVLIVAAGRRADANNAFEAIGWGPGNFSVELSAAPGGGPVTNYALSGVFTEADKGMLIDAIDNGNLPNADWNAAGTTATKAKNAFGQMDYAFSSHDVDPLAQFNDTLQGKALTLIQDEEAA